MKPIGIITALLFALGCNVVAQNQPPAAPLTDMLQRKVRPWVVAKETSIGELAAHLNVSGGVVFMPEIDIERKYRFEPARLVVRDVLDAVVKVDPEYRWEAQDGIINLLPANKYPAFLDTIIPEFEVKDETTLRGFDSLEEMPIFQRKAITFGYDNYTVPRIINESRLSNGKKFSVHCKNATVRGVLNAIVRAHGRAVWGFREYTQDGHKFFDLWFVLG